MTYKRQTSRRLIHGLTGFFAPLVLILGCTSGSSLETEGQTRLGAIRSSGEYGSQEGLDQINAGVAYTEHDVSGRSVRVAVVDEPISQRAQMEEFGERLHRICMPPPDADLGAPCSITAEPEAPSGENHGAQVASIIGAARNLKGIHGVSYEAEINAIPIEFGPTADDASGYVKLNLQNLYANDAHLASIFATARANGDVVNISWVYPGQISAYTTSQIEGILTKTLAVLRTEKGPEEREAIFVFAAGNAHGECPERRTGDTCPVATIEAHNPEILAGLPARVAGLPPWLAVVAVDNAEGRIADFSNRCGIAQAFCLAAPGVNIRVLNNDGSYEHVKGTSFAAPHVSGALTLLIELFPSLSPAEIVHRLLATANKEGFYADESVYGQGLLDIAAATEPVEEASIVFGRHLDGGRRRAVAGTGLRVAAAFGDSLVRGLAGRRLAVFDALDAPFFIPLSDFVSHARATQFETFWDDTAPKRTEVAGFGVSAHAGRGLARHFSALGAEETTANPYLRLSGAGIGAQLGFETSHGRIALIAATELPEDDTPLSPGLPDEEEKTTRFTAALSYEPHLAEGRRVGVQTGILVEDTPLLGSEGRGGFGARATTQTLYAALSGAVRLAPNLRLLGSLHAGASYSDSTTANTLLHADSTVLLSAFAAALERRAVLVPGDRLLLSLSQPLRVEEGDAVVSFTSDRTRARALLVETRRFSLVPSGRTLDVQIAYHRTLGGFDTRIALIATRAPGHRRDADMALGSVFILKKSF